MAWHGYIALTGINPSERAQLKPILRRLCKFGGDQPHKEIKWRIALDNTAILLSGEFNNFPTKTRLRNAIIAELGGDPTAIDLRIGIVVFGDANTTYRESNALAQEYMNGEGLADIPKAARRLTWHGPDIPVRST